MEHNVGLSVHLYECSDELIRKVHPFLEKTKGNPSQTHRLDRCAPSARFPHRALYPLRKTKLQMRPWPRPWAKVLPVRQLPRSKSPTRLLSPAFALARRQIPGQLPKAQSFFGADLRHKSRVIAKEGGTLASAGRKSRLHLLRSHGRRDNSCQYALLLFGGAQTLCTRFRGGER